MTKKPEKPKIYSDVRSIWTSEDPFNIAEGFIHKSKKTYIYNGGASFDCETTSTYQNGDKVAFMYIWMFCINECIVYGRTWEDFVYFMDKMRECYQLDKNRYIIIYVHNLAFDFQFFRKWFKWDKVFALSKYEPLYARTEGYEFRCSYQLSGSSLDRVARELHDHEIRKLKGDLDYDRIRHSGTFLSPSELEYCFNDVLIVQYYIDEQIAQYGRMWKIPLTNTGRVRQFCRTSCLYRQADDGRINMNRDFKRLMKSLTIEPEEYVRMRATFQGGFTHANGWHVGHVLYNVTSFDFTSSYPAVMICEDGYPMGKGERVKIESREQYDRLLKRFCLIFSVRFTNLRQKDTVYENYLSSHKCQIEGDRLINNGRIVYADQLSTIITNVDFEVIEAFYDWDRIEIGTCYRYRKYRLPKPFLRAVMELYKDKTELKDVPESAVEYQLKKGMLNSTYGMTVTDIIRPEISLSDDWIETPVDIGEELDRYNAAFNRFLFYPWGIFITAFARRNLFTAIKAVGFDYVYADTDSIKLLNFKDHEDYFKKYNERIEKKMQEAMRYLGMDENAYKPLTVKGIPKPLGVWDYEGTYDRFKTLGAKRYMTEDSSGCRLTLAGLGKRSGMEDIKRQAERRHMDVFDVFNEELSVEPEHTGKLTHTYIDEEIKGTVTDLHGVAGSYHELSYIHLEKAPFRLSLADEYADYIQILTGGMKR